MDFSFLKNYWNKESFIWANGKIITLFKIEQEKQNGKDNFYLSIPRYLQYAKKSDSNNENFFEETPISIAISNFHYFLLHSDSITIISIITEKVVECFDVNNILDS